MPPWCQSILSLKVEAVQGKQVSLEWTETSGTDFSGGRSGGLVFPSLSEFSMVCCDPHSQGFSVINEAEVDVFS